MLASADNFAGATGNRPGVAATKAFRGASPEARELSKAGAGFTSRIHVKDCVKKCESILGRFYVVVNVASVETMRSIER
jgi:hypothetical protein